MFMEQPKVDFVALQLDDVVTASGGPGSSVAFCQRAGDNNDDCSSAPFGTSYNLYGKEDCGGDLSEFDY